MVEITDIVDWESLLDWLEGRPQEVSVWIAHRSAMRLLPVWWEFVQTSEVAKKDDLTVLPVLRSNLISGVARAIPTPDLSAAIARPAIARAAAYATRADADAADAATARFAAYAARAAADAADAAAARAATDAARAAAYAADATDATAAYWKFIQIECETITSGADLDRLPLWRDRENPYEKIWTEVKTKLPTATPSRSEESARGALDVDWSFWIKWYDDALNGIPPNWEMLERIALIDPKDWDKGAERVNNELIPEILKDYPDWGVTIANDAPSTVKRIETIRQSIARNRATVPAQLQGLMAIITAEMERLRSINVMDDIEAASRDRLLGIFQSLADGLEALEIAVPLDREPTTEDAEKVDGLLTVYGNEFRKWPRDNANDMVDSTVRVALVGMTAGLAVTFGAPALVGVAIGGIAFGGKKLAGAAKSLKDSAGSGS